MFMPDVIRWNTTASGRPSYEDGGDGGEADREGHRHAQQQAEHEDDAQDGQCHDGSTSSPRSSAMMCSSENRTISAPAITSGR